MRIPVSADVCFFRICLAVWYVFFVNLRANSAISWTNRVRDWSCLDFSPDVQHALIACVKRRISDVLWHSASAGAHCSSTTAFKSTAAVVISEPPTDDHSPSGFLLAAATHTHCRHFLLHDGRIQKTALVAGGSCDKRHRRLSIGDVAASARQHGRPVEIISQVLLDGRRFAMNGDILNVSALIPLTDSRRDEWFARRRGFLSTPQSRLTDTSQESVSCMAWEN